MKIAEIVAAPWYNKAATDALAVYVRHVLDHHPGPLGTTQLVWKLSPSGSAAHITELQKRLSSVRQLPAMVAYWRQGEKKTTFGHPVIIWQKRADMPEAVVTSDMELPASAFSHIQQDTIQAEEPLDEQETDPRKIDWDALSVMETVAARTRLVKARAAQGLPPL